jgi:hypothetical protein
MESYYSFRENWENQKIRKHLKKTYLNKHPLDYEYNIKFEEVFKPTESTKEKEIAEIIFKNFKFLSGLSQDFLIRHTILLEEKNIPEDDTFAIRSIVELAREWNIWCDSKEIDKDELERFLDCLPKEIHSFYEFYQVSLSNVLNFFEGLIEFLNNKKKISVFINRIDRENFINSSKNINLQNLKQGTINNILQSCSDTIHRNKVADTWFKDNWKFDFKETD